MPISGQRILLADLMVAYTTMVVEQSTCRLFWDDVFDHVNIQGDSKGPVDPRLLEVRQQVNNLFKG